MHHRNFEVCIKSEGKRLEEYQVEMKSDRTITCFIPSESGKKFSVHFKSPLSLGTSSVRCRIDGRPMGASICRAGTDGHRWGVRVSPDLRHPFQFSEISLTDDENAYVENSILQNIGTIEVNVIRVQDAVHVRTASAFGDVATIGLVHEKSKKAGSHCVGFGQAKKCRPHRRIDSVPLFPGEGAWVKFRFLYRPRDILRAQGIIPAAAAGPSQPAAAGSRVSVKPEESSSRNPASVLSSSGVGKRRRRSGTLKDDNQSTSDRPTKRVKSDIEPHVSLLSTPSEIIDLTEDFKRESSPIRLAKVHVGQVIDLTLDD